MTKRAEIGLGDLIRVVEVLAPNDAAMARRLARILQVGEVGVEVLADDAEPAAGAANRPEPRAGWGAVELQRPPAAMPPHEPVAPLDPAPSPAPSDHAWTPKPRRADSLPAYDVASTLPAPAPSSTAPGPLPPALSLFQPRWTRSLLTAAMATEQAEGDVDLDRLVDALVRRVALRELPRRPRRTMRLGAHVLVERGDAMLPFRRDVAQILERIRGIGGNMTTLSFRGDPARVYRRSPRDVMPHVAPRAGTPVVAIGGLGVGDRSATTPGRWLAWAQRLHYRDCPVVLITPIARGDWPAALLRFATIIPWDRATTSSAVHRARAGRRVG